MSLQTKSHSDKIASNPRIRVVKTQVLLAVIPNFTLLLLLQVNCYCKLLQ